MSPRVLRRGAVLPLSGAVIAALATGPALVTAPAGAATPATTLATTAASAAATASGTAGEVTLESRAVLPADATWPGPWDGVPNTDPDPGATSGAQPIGGFSALVEDGRGRFWAMTDNGFGSKANSRSFILRVYLVEPHWRTVRGGELTGDGDVTVRRAISLSDPRGLVPWPIVAEGTRARLLTGGDFDIESLRIADDGTMWFGEEFGPFLLHTDRRGRLIEPPIPTPGVTSPDSPLLPPGAEANLPRSSGFEAMALTADGRSLLPVLEGALTTQDPLRRTMLEYDPRRGTWTGRSWVYPMSRPGTLVSDMTALDEHRYLVLERDNGQGAAAEWKRVFVVDLRAADDDGLLVKHEVADLLDIADPAGVSLPGRPGDLGVGEEFSFPYVTVEAVLPLPARGDDVRLAIVNDTNFGSTGRNPDLPDDSDFIVVRVPGPVG